MSTNCDCNTEAPKLVFSCSGAADVGAVADKAARKVTKDGLGKMFCLAGIGGRVEPIMDTTRKAAVRIAVDGCPLNCVKHCLEEAGIENVMHVQLADLGMTKGKTPVNEEMISRAAAEIATALAASSS